MHFGELAPSDVKHPKALEAENARLKKLLAERDLDIEVLKEINRRKWQARRRGARRSRSLADAAGPSDLPAGCWASPAPALATSCACPQRTLP
jgi:hypothetical protein